MRVVVMGVGFYGAFPASAGLSYRELTARAARMAYQDAGLTAGEVDGAVVAEEDFVAGYSISDEYSPDQLGMVRKAVYTINGDFLHALGSAAMQIKAGQHRRLLVSAYCKASNIVTRDNVNHFAFDPSFDRFGVSSHYLAGLEMRAFLDASTYDLADVADVVVQNRKRATMNPMAPYGSILSHQQVASAHALASPVTDLMVAAPSDGAVVAVLAAEDAGIDTARAPVRLAGTGWASGTPSLGARDHAASMGTAIAAQIAYNEAKVTNPAQQIDAAFVSDLYAHRQLMHLEALGLDELAGAVVNPDGGALGVGDMYEATGGVRFFEAVRQLRGEAGATQLPGLRRVLVHGWRGLPTDSCAVAILDGERSAS
jgi:acetyl-CoA C-acetyltransferase